MKKAVLIILFLLLIVNIGGVSKPNTVKNNLKRYIIFLKWDVPAEKLASIYRNYGIYIAKAGSVEQKEVRLDAMRKEIHRLLENHFKPKFDYIMDFVKELGGKPIKYIVSGPAVVAYLTEDMVKKLEELPIVDHIIKDFKIRACLNVAVPTLLPDEWYAHGYDGSNDIGDNIKGIEVAICDTGIYKNHPALVGKVIDERDFSDDGTTDDLNGHGTMVAGIVASSDSTYRGIAYGVNLLNAKCMNANGEGDFSWLMEAVDWAVGSATDTAEIINTSLGGEYTPDGESDLTKYLDKIVDLYHVVWVTAAGNKNLETGYNIINVPGDNFNGITVGATDDKGTISRDDDTYASFSCVGPTTDGRIKPDVVAPGTSITSTDKYGGFSTGSGTSFATPLVSGATALIAPYMIEKLGSQWYLGVKALLINTANDMEEIGSDNKTGWGLVNLQKAWESHNYTYVVKLSDGEMAIYSTYLTSGDTLSVTIVWDRVYKGETLLGGIQFYDLTKFKIEIYDPNGNLVAETDDTTNNVQKITYTATVSGIYMILIKVVSIDSQLVIDNGGDYVAINSNVPLIAGALNVNTTLETSLNSTILEDSQTLGVNVYIKNTGNETLHDVSIKVSSAKLITIDNISEYSIGDLEPNETYSMRIDLRAYYLGQDIVKILLFSKINGVKVLINSSEHKVTILDDDTSPPKVTIEEISGYGIAFTNIQIKVRATDNSGIKSIVLLYSVGKPVKLNSYDGILVANVSGEETAVVVFNLQIDFLWIGETIYFAAYAVDADMDRPNDTETSSLTVNSLYEVPLELNLAVFIGPIILIAIVLSLVKRKPKKKKVRSRIIREEDVFYI